MRKVFHKIHLWLSIPFGLIISIICFSGAALVFEDEVMELLHHDLYFVKRVEAVPLPIGQLAAKVAETLPDSISVAGVNVSSDPERAYQVSLSKPKRASVYIDQYTGEIKGKYERASFFTTMFRLHRWLLDSMKPDSGIFWGRIIVGISTLVFIFVLISGIVVWIPRTAKALRNRLKISVTKGWRRFWYDLHLAGGMYALLLLLAMSLTGLTWSFSWYRTGFYKVFGAEMQQNSSQSQSRSHSHSHSTASQSVNKGKRQHSSFTSWQNVYEQLKAENPDYKQINISNGSANVSFNRFGNQRASDRYSFNPRNGEITETTFYKDLDNSGKIRGWILSVHIGNWGGMCTRILSFLVALLGATLPLTGYYLWIKKKVSRSARTSKGKPHPLA